MLPPTPTPKLALQGYGHVPLVPMPDLLFPPENSSLCPNVGLTLEGMRKPHPKGSLKVFFLPFALHP